MRLYQTIAERRATGPHSLATSPIHNPMKTGKLAAGIVIGAAFGAALSMIFVTERVIRKRNRLLSKGKDYVEDIENQFDQFLESATESYECMRREAAKLRSMTSL